MPDTVQQSPPRRSAARRWTLRLLVALFSLLVVIIVVTQIVLGTSIPKEIVIAQVQKALGLHFTAEDVSTGWFGHTTLRNVAVSLPLAEKAFLEIPELHVTHTVLPILLITQSLDIKALSIDRPKVYVTQALDGRWNLEDVAQILLRMGGGGQGPSNQHASPVTLPSVVLRNGEIDVTDNTDRHVNIMPLNVTGNSVNALVWKYDATCDTATGAKISLSGRVAPNDNFSHEVDFALSDLASAVRPWVPGFDPRASVRGHWRGAATADGISGRLQLENLNYQQIVAQQGDVAIAASGASVSAIASQLIVHVGHQPLESFAVSGGTFSFDAGVAKVDALQLSALNGRVIVDATYHPSDTSGHLHAEWKTLQPTPALSSSGSIDAGLRTNWPDQKAVNVALTASGIAAENSYRTRIELTGGGKSWDAATFALTAPTLRFDGKQSVVLDRLTAQIATTPDQVTLTDLNVPDARDQGSSMVQGGGGFHFDPNAPAADKYKWWLYLLGQDWAIPRVANATLGFGVNVWGDPAQIHLQQAWGIVGKIYAGMEGYYRFARPKPVEMNLAISELAGPIGNKPEIIRGTVRGEGVLEGTVYPPSLDATGQLHGENIVIDNRPPQRIRVKCTAGIHHSLFTFDTEELALLGGDWSLHGRLPARDPSHGNAPDLTLRFHDLPLANVAELVHQPDVSGVAAGSLEADIDEMAMDQITAQGKFDLANVHARQFKADSITANISLRDGLLQLSPIQLRLADGHAQAKLSTNLSNPQVISVWLDAANWPVDLGPVHGVASASTENLSIDAMTQAAIGQLKFSASARLEDRPLLAADGTVGVAARVLNLQAMKAKILGGEASGSAMVDLDHPLTSHGTLRWDDLNLNELASYNSVYQTATGFLTGRADLVPTTDPRALGPLMLDIASVGQATQFRSVKFTEIHLPIFFSADRAVLSGGRIDVAGGSVGLFARASLHAQDTLTTLTEATLTNLDLEQLLHAADKTEAQKLKAYPGLLDGRISILGDPRDKTQMFGSVSLQIHDSDLGSFGPFAVLYDTMHLGGTAGKKVGTGSVEARYDNDNVIISSLRYYNRGVDAYGLATINNISRYPNCPLGGELVGTYSPLKSIKLPFFADADKIFSVLQANLTSIVIGGTIAKPSYLPESAADIGATMRNFLLGDVTQSK
jgi:hypothetical protein